MISEFSQPAGATAELNEIRISRLAYQLTAH